LNSPSDGSDLGDRIKSLVPTQALARSSRLREPEVIAVRGARTHNLANVDVDIPRNQLVVITGLSGSGKSSLAFDTLYAEGQRRYVESLSAYARQFLDRLDKPDVDLIEGLSPAIAIEQKATNHNPRSTVGTVTEIHDYLRLLMARAGTPHCPDHQLPLVAHTVAKMVDTILGWPEGERLLVLAPTHHAFEGDVANLLAAYTAQGFVRFRINGELIEGDALPASWPGVTHRIDVVVDRLRVRADMGERLAQSLETALNLAEGKVRLHHLDDGRDTDFQTRLACPECDFHMEAMEPRLFSFNSPMGACPSCDGLGIQDFVDPQRVVAFPSISLASGAIKGWDRRNPYYHGLIEALAKHYGFDPETPFEDLPPQVQQVLLYGSGDEVIAFTDVDTSGRGKTRRHAFEGIVPNMDRRYRETDSAVVREELSRYRSHRPCPDCQGTRLRREARHVLLGTGPDALNIHQLTQLTLADAQAHFEHLQLEGGKADIADKVVREIGARLGFLNDVGLNYLSLSRRADTLSGGEAQRIRLASQIGSGLSGVMYVLDEPSIGLHQRDNDRLIATLRRLRDLGNSVIVVEHDEDMIRAAEYCIDMGPGAGVRGGQVTAQGTPEDLMRQPASLTGQYLSGERCIAVPGHTRPWQARHASEEERQPVKNAFGQLVQPALPTLSERHLSHQCLRIEGARGHNLQGVDAVFPIGLLTCVTGVSGSGKSTLVNDTLAAHAAHVLHRAHAEPAAFDDFHGLEHLDKIIVVDQSPIGRTPRSNPATYTGLFTPLRELFAEVPLARERGYGPGRFSFNVAGGRCEACQGDGVVRVEMHFLPDVYVTCDVCHGKRYNRETLEVRYKGLSIAEVLDLSVDRALEVFAAVPTLQRKLQTLVDVGLGYIRLGQPATTLSGGEAQRVKLALELSRRDTGRTLYILDEPTTGLHFADIELLLKVLHQLVDAGNTMVIIEHNLDVIKTADWLIDMGPEGGNGGGQVVAMGTPEELIHHPHSHTGRYLKRYFSD
jgi:excinuclease ABC subunit A